MLNLLLLLSYHFVHMFVVLFFSFIFLFLCVCVFFVGGVFLFLLIFFLIEPLFLFFLCFVLFVCLFCFCFVLFCFFLVFFFLGGGLVVLGWVFFFWGGGGPLLYLLLPPFLVFFLWLSSLSDTIVIHTSVSAQMMSTEVLMAIVLTSASVAPLLTLGQNCPPDGTLSSMILTTSARNSDANSTCTRESCGGTQNVTLYEEVLKA